MSVAKPLFAAAFLSILILAFIPSYARLPNVVSVSDILNHFAAFFLLYLLHVAAYPLTSANRRILFLLLTGLFIEVVQYFLPTRDASLGDLAVDITAVLSAHYFYRLYRRLRPAAL